MVHHKFSILRHEFLRVDVVQSAIVLRLLRPKLWLSVVRPCSRYSSLRSTWRLQRRLHSNWSLRCCSCDSSELQPLAPLFELEQLLAQQLRVDPTAVVVRVQRKPESAPADEEQRAKQSYQADLVFDVFEANRKCSSKRRSILVLCCSSKIINQ